MINALDYSSDTIDTLDDIVMNGEGQWTVGKKRKRNGAEVDSSLLLQFDILYQRLRSEMNDLKKKRKRVYVVAPLGVKLIFDANKYEFVVQDYLKYQSSENEKRALKTTVDIDSAVALRFMNCLDLTMNRKRIRIKLPVGKREQRNCETEELDDIDDYAAALACSDTDIPKKGLNGTAFVYPVAPMNIATFAYTQGRSISHPVVVCLNRNQDAYSVITALTRSEIRTH